jgi:SAM-dependent methyltransferase
MTEQAEASLAAALEVLRSPAGFPLRRTGDELLCEGTGRRYAINAQGTPLLYDDADISPFLRHDTEWFAARFEFRETPLSMQESEQRAIYQRARFINTEFMFTAFAYDEPSRRRVLEIGVGDAGLIQRFARAGFDAWAVDYFPYEMELARDADPGAHFHTVAAPMSRLPFADGSFDLVYLHAALHHALPNDHAAFEWLNPRNMADCLREIRRVLRPREAGGAFVLMGEGVYPEGIRPQDRHYEVDCQADPDRVYEAWYTLGEYEQAFRGAGLFPSLFTWQEGLRLQAFAYTAGGEKRPLVHPQDAISDHNYRQLPRLLQDRLGNDGAVLPPWIWTAPAWEGHDPLAPALTPVRTDMGPHVVATQVYRGWFTVVGNLVPRGGVAWLETRKPGFLAYGPYCRLPPGRYLATVLLELGEDPPQLLIDVPAQGVVLAQRRVTPDDAWRGTRLVSVPFDLPAGGREVEVRIVLETPGRAACAAALAIHTLM